MYFSEKLLWQNWNRNSGSRQTSVMELNSLPILTNRQTSVRQLNLLPVLTNHQIPVTGFKSLPILTNRQTSVTELNRYLFSRKLLDTEGKLHLVY